EVALMKLSDNESDSDGDLSESDVLDDTFENINHPTHPRQDDESDSDDDLYVLDENVNHPTPNINPRHYLLPDELTTPLPIPKRRRLSD
ncbi:1065_t:CDS:1, partial [Gigaspora rosea]